MCIRDRGSGSSNVRFQKRWYDFSANILKRKGKSGLRHGCRVVVEKLIREKRDQFHLRSTCALSFLSRQGDCCVRNVLVQWEVSGSNPRNSKPFGILNAAQDHCSPTVYVVVVVVALVLYPLCFIEYTVQSVGLCQQFLKARSHQINRIATV